MPRSPLFKALASLDNPSADNASGKPLALLEDLFERSHKYKSGFSLFIQELIESSFWKSQDFLSNPFPRLCIDLSLEIDRTNDSMGPKEPPYHCRGHFQDVCLAITLLLQQPIKSSNDWPEESPWLMSPEDAWLLLFCAIGHDYGHNGSINRTPFELEKASIEKIQSFLHQHNASPRLIEQIMSKVKPIILSTDPSAFNDLVDKFVSNRHVFTKEDCMSMLLVEADLMGSVLPVHGIELGQQLSQEWMIGNPESALRVTSTEGRLGFLRHIQFISPHSTLLGMDNVRQISINKLKN